MLQAWFLLAGMDAEAPLHVTQHLSRDEALAHFTQLYTEGRVVWGEVHAMRDGVLHFEMRLPTGLA